MYDENIIINLMPKLKKLAAKYANEQHDEDELLSEGQLYLLEYLANKQNAENREQLSHKAYVSVNNRLKTFTSKPIEDTVALNDCVIVISHYMSCDSEKLIALIKDILSDKEFNIIMDYYGMYSNGKTCEEIAKEFGLSGSRISEIRRHAEYKIRHNFRNKHISLEDLL
ncbi:MAG: hypothetical protein IJZ79_02980 [Bacilli bacterium]|nr:hypothetical protein [Bacilli bacterium]MBQ8218690.1 hypothetical protein [Bacilli bacterium]